MKIVLKVKTGLPIHILINGMQPFLQLADLQWLYYWQKLLSPDIYTSIKKLNVPLRVKEFVSDRHTLFIEKLNF